MAVSLFCSALFLSSFLHASDTVSATLCIYSTSSSSELHWLLKTPTKNIKSNSIPQMSALWKLWLQQRDPSKGLLLLVSSIVTAVRSLSPNAQWQRKETGVRQWGEAEWKPFLLGDSAALVFVCAAYQTSTSACIRACVCCPWVHSCQVESHSRSSQCWYFLLLILPPLKCTVPPLKIWRHLFSFFFADCAHPLPFLPVSH